MHTRVLPYFYLRRDKRLIANEVSNVRLNDADRQLPEKRDLVVFCPLATRQVVAYRAFIASGGRFLQWYSAYSRRPVHSSAEHTLRLRLTEAVCRFLIFS